MTAINEAKELSWENLLNNLDFIYGTRDHNGDYHNHIVLERSSLSLVDGCCTMTGLTDGAKYTVNATSQEFVDALGKLGAPFSICISPGRSVFAIYSTLTSKSDIIIYIGQLTDGPNQCIAVAPDAQSLQIEEYDYSRLHRRQRDGIRERFTYDAIQQVHVAASALLLTATHDVIPAAAAKLKRAGYKVITTRSACRGKNLAVAIIPTKVWEAAGGKPKGDMIYIYADKGEMLQQPAYPPVKELLELRKLTFWQKVLSFFGK